MRTLTVYLHIGSDGRSGWPNPRLVKTTTTDQAKTDKDTISVVKLNLKLPEECFTRSKPSHTVDIQIDPSKVVLVEVEQEEA